jgi:membrane protease YdiL (CAAX protease family)
MKPLLKSIFNAVVLTILAAFFTTVSSLGILGEKKTELIAFFLSFSTFCLYYGLSHRKIFSKDACLPLPLFGQQGLSRLFPALVFSVLAALICVAGVAVFHGQPQFKMENMSDGFIMFALVLTAAAAEEVLFRGYLFAMLRTSLKPASAIILTSLVFAAGHFPFKYGIIDFVSHFAFGAALIILAIRNGSLLPGVILHAAFNLCSDLTSLPFANASGISGFLEFSGGDPTESFLFFETLVFFGIIGLKFRTRMIQV